MPPGGGYAEAASAIVPHMRAFCLVFLWSLLVQAQAQGQDGSPEPIAGTVVSREQTDLRELRLRHVAARRREGLWLLGAGAVSAAFGGALGLWGRNEEARVVAGATCAAFGAINLGLSFGLLDVSGERRAAIERQPTGAYRQQREAELVAQLRSAQGFALNTGLDVFYIGAGALLVALGHARGGELGWEQGAGLAMMGQGGFLLGFDVAGWVLANRRANAVRALF